MCYFLVVNPPNWNKESPPPTPLPAEISSFQSIMADLVVKYIYKLEPTDTHYIYEVCGNFNSLDTFWCWLCQQVLFEVSLTSTDP